MRANWGRGFKAPSLPEITPSSAYFFTQVADPPNPGGHTSTSSGVDQFQPSLQPEKSRSFTMGFVWGRSRLQRQRRLITRSSGPTRSLFRTSRRSPTDSADPKAMRDPASDICFRSPGSTSTSVR